MTTNKEALLNYVWETQIMPQAGYSFSKIHSLRLWKGVATVFKYSS